MSSANTNFTDVHTCRDQDDIATSGGDNEMDDNVGVIHEDEDIDEVPETVTTIKNKATRPSAPQM